ncbi:hypothetical protein [Bacillus cereus]|uniref:Uncharacterized protein n=1 Tax=Bacillus cereus TaxID=1396 RepID=A0A2A7HQU9_BACCE|nr:hypothetical protein [Bacillus cereus]PEC19338.1 hypothetical protein COM96_25595 [Bacillus cereus]
MKKFTQLALTGAIVLGGLGMGAVADLPMVPGGQIQKAAAASAYGVSVNTTKANWTNSEGVHVMFKNDNSYEVKLVGQLQYLENGSWVNKGQSYEPYALPKEYFGYSLNPIGTDGTYRYRTAVYKVDSRAETFQGYVYTSNFYVK